MSLTRKTSTDEEYIVVDHVTDQRTKTSYRLLDPLVFKAKQDQIKQMYPLKKVRLVNWDPWEEVINKNNKHYQGCNTDVTHATCGVQYDANNKTIEYSEGFCCSCDAYVNMYRQPADFSQDFIHLPVDTAASDQRNKRDVVEGIAENLINVWRGQVIADFTTHYATDSRLSQIRTKKEIGKFLLEKATRALENIKQFSNVHFDSAKPPQPNRSSIKLTRCQSFPNYITIPGLETAYGFTSNDTTRLNAMVDPWDLPLSHVTSSSHSKNDQLKNQHFFHVLGEIQTGNLNASYESNIADKSIQCKANTLSECNKTQYKRSVTTNVVITSCPANNKTNTNSISQVDYICLVNRVYTETVTAESNTIEYKGMNILSNSVTSQSGTSNTLDTMTSTKESITTAKQNLNVPLCIKKNIFVNVSNNIESSKENLDIKKSKSYVQGTIEHHTSTNTPNPMMVSTWENFPAPKSNHNHIECSTIENINPNPNITSLIVATEFQNISTLEPTNINNLTENIVDHKPNETVNIIVTNTPNNSMLSSRKIYVNTRISNNDDNMKSVPSEIWQNISKFTQTEAANIVNKMPPNVMQNISMSNLINTQDIMLNNNLPSTVKENMTKEKNNIVISTAAKKGKFWIPV
ncbi:hypothetical protein M8J76_015447 [Diaphorina citri]|nr:hypothetical protein M8J76_015447 [Diaphorina citri]